MVGGTVEVPVGFKFLPTNEQLVLHHLLKKVRVTHPLPLNCIIHDSDIYGDNEPWQIWDFLGGASASYNDNGFLYVFTPLKKKTPTSSRFTRKVGLNGGVWHGEDSAKSFIVDGIKWTESNFRYQNPNCKTEDGRWLMREYRLIDDHNDGINIVLCRIKKKEAKKRKQETEISLGLKVNNNAKKASVSSMGLEKDNSESESQCSSMAADAVRDYSDTETIEFDGVGFTIEELLGDEPDGVGFSIEELLLGDEPDGVGFSIEELLGDEPDFGTHLMATEALEHVYGGEDDFELYYLLKDFV